MKNAILSMLTVLMSVVSAFGENVNDTTIVYNGMDIHISGNEASTVKVAITSSNSTVFSAVYEEQSDTVSVRTIHRIREDIPLLNLLSSDSRGHKKRHNYFDPHIGSFNVGFNFPENTSNGIPDNNVARSINITFIPFDHGFAFSKNAGLGIGFGFEWENYRLTDDEFFKYEEGMLTVANVKTIFGPNAHMDDSKLRTFGFVFPIMWCVNNRGLNFNAGVVANVVPLSRFNSKVSVDDEVMKFRCKGLHHNPFGCDLAAKIGYRDIGIFARYSLTDLFKDDHGPKMRTLTCGLSFCF